MIIESKCPYCGFITKSHKSEIDVDNHKKIVRCFKPSGGCNGEYVSVAPTYIVANCYKIEGLEKGE